MTALVEYEATAVTLDPRDLDFVLDLVRYGSGDARVLHGVTPTHRPGVYELVAGPYVGRIGLPSGDWLDLQSRFPIEDVIELIRASGRHPVRLGPLAAPGETSAFLVDAIAIAFDREVSSLLGSGLAKGYIATRCTVPPYAGRLDTSFHLGRLAARPDRLATISRRLTSDIIENQALAVALDVLRQVPLQRSVSMRLASLASAFRRVSRPHLRAEQVAAVHLTNLTRRYETALALAEAILRSQSLAPRSAQLPGASLLFWMPKVWENYVAAWLREKWPDHRIVAPYRFVLTDDGQYAEADATVWDGDTLIALYDAKYKWPDRAPSRSDLYQMITYCERLGLSDAWLVYPASVGSWKISVLKKNVHVLGVNPDATRETGGVVRPPADEHASR